MNEAETRAEHIDPGRSACETRATCSYRLGDHIEDVLDMVLIITSI
ncbi:hypothetical protein [Limnohabitans sp.]|jgi:hypothetical protein